MSVYEEHQQANRTLMAQYGVDTLEELLKARMIETRCELVDALMWSVYEAIKVRDAARAAHAELAFTVECGYCHEPAGKPCRYIRGRHVGDKLTEPYSKGNADPFHGSRLETAISAQIGGLA